MVKWATQSLNDYRKCYVIAILQVLISFVPEQNCFHISGFPDMPLSECVKILSQVRSPYYYMKVKGESTHGIIIFQLVRNSSDLERELVCILSGTELELRESQHLQWERQRLQWVRQHRQRTLDTRTSAALQAQFHRLKAARR